MQETCPPQGQILGHTGSNMGGVGEQVKGVVGVALVEAHLGRKLRDHCREDGGETAQIIGIGSQEQFT